jgi:glucose/arabinose dehydrogenase
VAIGVVVALLLASWLGEASARRPKPERCDPGRFLFTTAPPVDGAEALVVDRRTVAIEDGCAPARARFKARRRSTKLTVRWRTCSGVTGRVRLEATIAAPACTTLQGTFRSPRTRTRVAIGAVRSSCGDGTFDPEGGETCDAGAGCGAGESCDPETCACVTVTTTTTSTVTTTTCVAEVPTVPPLRIVPVNATAAGFATFARQPPGSADWYLVEQAGRILIIRDGQILPTPFLDIQAAMGTNAGERGLLSVAFHPGYAENGRFFTMATPADDSDGSYAPLDADAVVEWRRDPGNPDVAVSTKVQDIVVLPASDTNHNGGTIVFGPDNFLYVGTGDGGGACESSQPGAAQDTSSLFGKILRLDVDAAPPFAAAGNPFANDPRVYHYGLRNPFRFNFDPVTHDLLIGDVGQSGYEELSVAPANVPGQNFGWPAYEGTIQGTCGAKPLEGPSPHTAPILSIDRRVGSTDPFADYRSIIGGRVYRGAAMPALQGALLFADFYGAELGALRYCAGQLYGPVAVPLSQIPAPDGLSTISSFVEGNDGELYVTYGSATRVGRIAPQ